MSERLTMEHRRLIIDSHSHIGVGFNNRIATIEEYQIIKDKLNITISLLMPQPILNNLPRIFFKSSLKIGFGKNSFAPILIELIILSIE